jgi:hypothetical protein
MKTATITLPEPTINEFCNLSSGDKAYALDRLKRDMAAFIVAYTNHMGASPYHCFETCQAHNTMRGAVWMAAYCNLIDAQSAFNITNEALTLMGRWHAERNTLPPS